MVMSKCFSLVKFAVASAPLTGAPEDLSRVLFCRHKLVFSVELVWKKVRRRPYVKRKTIEDLREKDVWQNSVVQLTIFQNKLVQPRRTLTSRGERSVICKGT